MDGEIEKAQKGLPCGIVMKVNSITDRDVIDKLSQASCAGVRVEMIVRGHLLRFARDSRQDRKHPHRQHCWAVLGARAGICLRLRRAELASTSLRRT